jgi:uncharacterized protein YndB with AHSA1/START domain
MWEYEHSVETTAAPEAVWRLWSDMAGWPAWNDGIAEITVDGPFAVGTSFTMTPPGEEPISMRLTRVSPGSEFVDEMAGDGLVVTTVHRIDPLPAGCRVVYRTEITGDAAAEVGPMITADFPDVLAALVATATR